MVLRLFLCFLCFTFLLTFLNSNQLLKILPPKNLVFYYRLSVWVWLQKIWILRLAWLVTHYELGHVILRKTKALSLGFFLVLKGKREDLIGSYFSWDSAPQFQESAWLLYKPWSRQTGAHIPATAWVSCVFLGQVVSLTILFTWEGGRTLPHCLMLGQWGDLDEVW